MLPYQCSSGRINPHSGKQRETSMSDQQLQTTVKSVGAAYALSVPQQPSGAMPSIRFRSAGRKEKVETVTAFDSRTEDAGNRPFGGYSPFAPVMAALGGTVLTLACSTGTLGTSTPVAETVVCQEPVLELAESEGAAVQTIGDITITASTRMPRCEEVVRVSHETRSPSFGERLRAPDNSSQGYLTRREEVDLALARRSDQGDVILDENFDLLLSVTNQSQRVFRAEGAVFEYQIDGRTEAVSRDRYASFLGATILPGQARDFPIALPHTRIDASSVVSVFVYDVTVERDDAGIPTRRGNFDWMFTLNYFRREGTGAVRECNLPRMSTGEWNNRAREMIAEVRVLSLEANASDPNRCS